jgi:hypothetical protein
MAAQTHTKEKNNSFTPFEKECTCTPPRFALAVLAFTCHRREGTRVARFSNQKSQFG